MYNMYYFVHNINNSMRNDHFFLTKVSPKKQKIVFFRILADFGRQKADGSLYPGYLIGRANNHFDVTISHINVSITAYGDRKNKCKVQS